MKLKIKVGLIIILTIGGILFTPPHQEANAVIVIAQVIKEGVKKVIKAFDLMIQRLQNKTIWLQNAQKVLENKLSELKLKEIAQWTEKHRKLYEKYYNELWHVKNVLTAYQRIREATERQLRILHEYNRVWTLVKADKHFTEKEIDYIYIVYKGILHESMRNLDQIVLVVNSFKTQMSDAERLAIITQAGDRIEQNMIDLLEFNMNTYQLSLNRSRTQYEVDRVKRLYGF